MAAFEGEGIVAITLPLLQSFRQGIVLVPLSSVYSRESYTCVGIATDQLCLNIVCHIIYGLFSCQSPRDAAVTCGTCNLAFVLNIHNKCIYLV